jgi:hypothetical protein
MQTYCDAAKGKEKTMVRCRPVELWPLFTTHAGSPRAAFPERTPSARSATTWVLATRSWGPRAA